MTLTSTSEHRTCSPRSSDPTLTTEIQSILQHSDPFSNLTFSPLAILPAILFITFVTTNLTLTFSLLKFVILSATFLVLRFLVHSAFLYLSTFRLILSIHSYLVTIVPDPSLLETTAFVLIPSLAFKTLSNQALFEIGLYTLIFTSPLLIFVIITWAAQFRLPVRSPIQNSDFQINSNPIVSYITGESEDVHSSDDLHKSSFDTRLLFNPADLDSHNLTAEPVHAFLKQNPAGNFNINQYEFVIDNEVCDFNPDEDIILVSETTTPEECAEVFTAYKRVDQKIRPVKGTFPEEAHVKRQFPEDPLTGLTDLPKRPPNFISSDRLTTEQLNMLELNTTGFLLPEEEKLFQHVMYTNREALCYDEANRGTFKESYFSPYIIPTIPHEPWALKNIPIPPGIKDRVIEVLKNKISAGVYEPSQSSYRSRWFCVVKKSGKLRIVHDLQPLNRVTIRDAGLPPNLDTFVEPFAGRACFTVFDLFWGFDARKVAPACRDMTAFMTPLGLLRITSMPTGFTNSPAEFQQCMVFILQDEIPHIADIFIDDLPIKGPATQYLDSAGHPETLAENPGIRRFIWEHAVDVHRIMHRITQSGATFSPTKTQICRPEVLIVGQRCTAEGRLPDTSKVDKIKNWPPLTTPKEARAFMGLCGTVRIWIKNYSALARPITELWRKNVEFEWDSRRQSAFQSLKDLVSAAPALSPIDYSSTRPVILAVDSSWMAAGIILLQIDEKGQRRPARYGSIPFNDREQRYSQPKLELYGLFRSLRAFRLHLIGVQNLIVEVDALYIKGMLNEPDMQPNAAINRWIQGILLFDFELVHVAGTKHVGPDALSRRPLAYGETVEEEDDDWLDNIALLCSFTSLSP